MKKVFHIFSVALIAVMAVGFGGCKHKHDYVVLENREPTCTSDGYRKSRCNDCGEVLEETLYAFGHDYNIYNVCIRCNYDLGLDATVKLGYELTDDGKGYNVAFGTTSAKEIVIPAYNEGKPVLGVREEGFFSPIGDETVPTRAAEIVSATLPDGLESIGTRGFYGCVGLKTLSLPRRSLKTIGDLSFGSCTALESILNTPSGLESIGDNAFYSCSALRLLPEFPALRTVGEYAFARCTALESVYFGAATESVGAGVFSGCTRLKYASLGNAAAIPKNSFLNCTALEEVIVSPSLKEIGSSAFSECRALKAIRFGGTVEEWKAIKKADDWFLTSLEPGEYVDYYVYCTNGTVDHNGVALPQAG